MNEANETRKTLDIRPCYTCCHPNAKGTGSTVRFELHPAHDTVEGSVFITFASQKTVGSYENGRRILPTFDWANRVTVRLSLNEVAQMLEVFRGYREKMCDGNGLFHRTAKANTIITLEHRLEPTPAYMLGVSRKDVEGELKRINVFLSVPRSALRPVRLWADERPPSARRRPCRACRSRAPRRERSSPASTGRR